MAITRDNPGELHPTPGYHHVTRVRASELVFLAGQCPINADGSTAGADGDLADRLAAQVTKVAENVAAALASTGVGPADVVRTVIYVASDDRAVLGQVWGLFAASPIAEAFTTASTLLGVARLGFPDQLIELDVTAAVS